MAHSFLISAAHYFQLEISEHTHYLPTRGEEEHQKKIAKLPKTVRLPDGSRIMLR